jgi:outer membrane receptor protein involved in Fe transport
MAWKQRLAECRFALTLCGLLTTVLWIAPRSVLAQAETAESVDEAVEEIVVTGSRIKRRDFNSPSPIATIDRDAISFTGLPSLEEALNQMPQVVPDFGRSSNNPGNGTARINLRGMGSGRTLVLLNSRRIAPSGVGSAVDINNLPQALVDRVEIITGGATTVYGSDAVAGVVNFITRDDFSGLTVEASGNLTAENDAGTYDLNLAYGHNLASGRGNITVYAGTQDRESLYASERELTRVSWANDNSNGTLFQAGSPTTPNGSIPFPLADFGNGPVVTIFDADGTPRPFAAPDDLYNFQEVNYLQTPLTRYTGGIMTAYELDSGYELYLESGYSRNESVQVLASVPAVMFVQVNTDNPVLVPETQQFFIDNFQGAPGFAQFALRRRLSEIGQRIIEHNRDYWRTVAGVRGELADGWDIDGWLSYTKASENEYLVNDASASRYLQGLLVDPLTGQCVNPSNGCAPVDVFGPGRLSAEAANFLRVTDVQNNTDRIQQLASVVVTGSPFDSWAGPIDTAFGLEWRSDEASYTADEVLFTGDTLGFRGDAPVEGTERVIEIFGEAVIPLLQGASFADYLGLELGARYSEYDLAGGIWTYKVGGEWQPIEGLRFRGMHQRSVRAPNNLELFQEQFAEAFSLVDADPADDPCSAVNEPQLDPTITEKCIIQGLPADQVGIFEASAAPGEWIQGGNPELVPEVAKTWTIGAVITPGPLPDWMFSIDYFSMEITDSIGSIDALTICFDAANTENLFCENIRRDASAGYNVVQLYEPQSNRGIIGTKGIDTQVSYQTDLPEVLALFDNYAQLSINLVWTHMLENRWQLNPVTQIIDCAGFFGSFCGAGIDESVGYTLAENRVSTQIHYLSGAFSTHLTSRWIDGTTNATTMEAAFFGQAEPVLAIPSIGSVHYLDLGFGYEFSDSFSARIGVINVADKAAPNMADAVTGNNTDSVMFDVFGRSYFLSISAGFLQ